MSGNTKIKVKVVRMAKDDSGKNSPYYIRVDYPTVGNPTFLDFSQAQDLRKSLDEAIVDIKEIRLLQIDLSTIDSYLESLKTSLGAALGQLEDGDSATARDEIREMDSDLRDLCEMIDKF